jgi:glycosyltransferase involved in cell wall biosynthesis
MEWHDAPDIPIRSRLIKINENYRQYTYANLALLILDRLRAGRGLPEFVPSLLDRASLRIARNAIVDCDLVQVETPWPFDWVQRNSSRDKPMVLVEHDAAYRLYERQYPKSVLRFVREMEERALARADAVIAVSKENEEDLCRQYSIKRNKIYVVPHGVESSRVKPPSREEKADAKKRLGLSEKVVVLFAGSKHFANIRAVEVVEDIASKMRNENLLFLVAGSVGECFSRSPTGNIRYTGYVRDIGPYFRAADIAVNPVLFGSGTNTKMIEYLAYGLPTVTTDFGARGVSLRNGEHVVVSDIDAFSQKIRELVSNKDARQKLSEEGRKLVEECYDWKVIAGKVMAVYKSVLSG